MARFRARFCFNAGSGICLWADNEVTRQAFDDAIEMAKLPVPYETQALAEQMVHWYDAALNWWAPDEPLPEPWTEEEKEHFDRAAWRLLTELRDALGEAWEVADATTPLADRQAPGASTP